MHHSIDSFINKYNFWWQEEIQRVQWSRTVSLLLQLLRRHNLFLTQKQSTKETSLQQLCIAHQACWVNEDFCWYETDVAFIYPVCVYFLHCFVWVANIVSGTLNAQLQWVTHRHANTQTHTPCSSFIEPKTRGLMDNHDKNDQRILLTAFRHTLDVVKP